MTDLLSTPNGDVVTRDVPILAPPDSVRVQQVLITPDLAAEWLKRNKHNRKMRHRNVAFLANQMAEGAFDFNGETIKFDVDNELIDGQHRLEAIVEAGVAVWTLVVFGLPHGAQDTVDQGQKRTPADVLELAEKPYSTILASTTGLCIRVEKNVNKGNYQVSPKELVAYLAEHPAIEDAVSWTARTQTGYSWRDLAPTLFAYAYYMQEQVAGAEEAQEFWRSVIELVPAYRGDPAIALARRLGEMKRSRQRLPEYQVLDGVFRAWNRRRNTEPQQKVQFRPVVNFDQMARPR